MQWWTVTCNPTVLSGYPLDPQDESYVPTTQSQTSQAEGRTTSSEQEKSTDDSVRGAVGGAPEPEK